MDDDLARKTYEIAVKNQAHMEFLREKVIKIETLHESCPGRVHAIQSSGAATLYQKIALAVGMLGTFIMATLALLKR